MKDNKNTQNKFQPPPPPPPPPIQTVNETKTSKIVEKKQQKDMIAPSGGTDVHSQIKAALESKFKNANG